VEVKGAKKEREVSWLQGEVDALRSGEGVNDSSHVKGLKEPQISGEEESGGKEVESGEGECAGEGGNSEDSAGSVPLAISCGAVSN
jgi:hypothetical protein